MTESARGRAPVPTAQDKIGATMRKLIVSNLISLHGDASGPGGDMMALPFDTTFSDYNLELMQTVDTLVSGATTYRGSSAIGLQSPTTQRSPKSRGPSRVRDGELEHLVISNSLTAEETGPWREKTRIVNRNEARDATAQAKGGEGGRPSVFAV